MAEAEVELGNEELVTNFAQGMIDAQTSEVENMERMFAAVSSLYAEYWGDFFHFAIFEDETEDLNTAFARTHRGYAEALQVQRARNVLDLACGRGAFANFLAECTKAQVLGVDISRAQLSHATQYRRPNLQFRHHDAMRVDELPGGFDAVAFIDAEAYLPDKRAAVSKIGGVMNPGARLLLLAWCRRDGLNAVQKELVLHPFMRYWGIPSLETPAGYKMHFKRSGLCLVEEIDLNGLVRRNWEFGYRQALKAVEELSSEGAARLLWKRIKLGAEGIRVVKEQFPAALYIKAGFEAGCLRYRYFLLEKPLQVPLRMRRNRATGEPL
jgi:SAM-dependent methyltransferase